MKAVTIREAKARLNALVEAAERGEQIVLMRGAKHVALIVPLSDEDLEVVPRLTDAQAERLWRRLEQERREGKTLVCHSADDVVARLQAADAARTRGKGRRTTPRASSKRRR